MYIPYKLRILKQIPYQWKMLKRRLFRRSEGEEILRLAYRELYGKNLDLENGKTFTAKLFRRMILVNRHGNPVFTRLADKYLVRDYVRQKIGGKYLVNLIWHGKEPRKIPFITLPSKFVIKTNHGSGKNIVVTGAFDQAQIIKQLSGLLKNNYYWTAREYHYYKIPPQIIIEEFLDDGEPQGPLDYRFWCFNGRPELVQITNHSLSINPFYDPEWKKLALCYRDNEECEIKKPENLQEMLLIASKLASDFDFVRVDFYNIRGKIYFGELTFTPRAGEFKFKPESWDLFLGQKWIVD
jgi:hypothetical protein